MLFRPLHWKQAFFCAFRYGVQSRSELLQIEIEQLKHQNYLLAMEHDLLKNGRGGEERCLSQVRKSRVCVSIRECHCNNGYPVEAECGLLHVSRSACNWWASGKSSRYANRGCTRQAKEPQYLAENLLNRQFYAEMPNEKWLTDVTGFK